MPALALRAALASPAGARSGRRASPAPGAARPAGARQHRPARRARLGVVVTAEAGGGASPSPSGPAGKKLVRVRVSVGVVGWEEVGGCTGGVAEK
jgi:hypothetical protein